MHIIDKFVLGKCNDDTICEDGITITKNMIAIIDGVTSKTQTLYDGKKGGKFCKDFIVDFIENNTQKFTNAELFFSQISKRLRAEMQTRFPNVDDSEWPKASMIVFHSETNEIWSYGDCQCMINGKIYTKAKKIDELLSELRALYIELALKRNTSLQEVQRTGIGRNEIFPLLKEQAVFENSEDTEFGYPVINGQAVNSKLIQIYKAEKGDEVVLGTDGYPVLKPTLNESEEELAGVLNDDPICFRKYKSTKGVSRGNISFDDRAYCRFII